MKIKNRIIFKIEKYIEFSESDVWKKGEKIANSFIEYGTKGEKHFRKVQFIKILRDYFSMFMPDKNLIVKNLVNDRGDVSLTFAKKIADYIQKNLV